MSVRRIPGYWPLAIRLDPPNQSLDVCFVCLNVVWISLVLVQVNADRYVEQTVLVEVPSKWGAISDPTEVRPRVYNIVMEPIKTAEATTAANSIVNDGKQYTYWLMNGGHRVGATDRVAAAAAMSTERLSATTARAPSWAEQPEQEEDGDRDNFYDDSGEDVDLRLMRPLLPVSSFSASGAPSNRLFWPFYTVTLLYLVH